ncbi:cation transporter [Amphibiibacter pelophylacis]|uniref:Cation transporter n=1 Tax=Amphibiibacter pelophylacis TaxID=1799477 RepID=A0ACC6P3M0_9BURK
MSRNCAHGCSHGIAPATGPAYRHALWIALAVNAVMAMVEIVFGHRGDSVALLADAIDFLGDAVNYGLALWVLGGALAWRSRLALGKGAVMAAYGVFIIGKALWGAWLGTAPQPLTMGAIGLLALAANLGVAVLLYAWREGDANMRAVWLCTRNDALGNAAIVLAALGVLGSGTMWPDLIVAAIMGALALSAGLQVMRQARSEMAGGAQAEEAQGHTHGHSHSPAAQGHNH